MALAKKRKKFFDIEIPLIKKQTQLLAYEAKELGGKYITYDLTRILRGKSLILQAITTIQGDKIIAIPVKLTLMPYFLKRMVRKGSNYVEDSFSAKCKDAQIRIKPFLVTRRKVSRAVRCALREKAREELIEYVKNKDAEIIFDEVLKGQIQKPLSLKLKKIYPLSLCEIRILKIEKFLEKPKEEAKKEEDKINSA